MHMSKKKTGKMLVCIVETHYNDTSILQVSLADVHLVIYSLFTLIWFI